MKKNLRFFLTLLLVLYASLSIAQPAGYNFVREIIIEADQIPDGTNLTNFPYLFKVTHPDLRSTANGGHIATSNGYDVLFYQNSCSTPMDHQLDYYNPVTGELAVWVRIPVLSTTADTRIYIYYGNNTISSSTSVSTVWDTGYNGIWHLGNSPAAASPQITDATANAHNGTANGGMTLANLVSGKIGQALNFDEVNDYVRIPDFLYGQELTVSFWFNATEVNGNSYQYLFSHGTWATQNSLNVYVGEDNITIPSEVQNLNMLKTVFRDNNDANNFDTLDAGNTFINGNWHYYTMRIQNFGGATIYIDGAQVAVYSVWGANTFNPATDIFLAGREDLNPGRFYGGMLDEVRISSVWRSSNWIRTEYNNQSDPASFSSMGVEAPSVGYCSPLALTTINFTATRKTNTVQVKWDAIQTTSSTNIFIERSIDNKHWQVIGNVKNKNAFTDLSPLSTQTFYRLRYNDEYREYISLSRAVNALIVEENIKVYPNPALGGEFVIELPENASIEQFSLVNIAGVDYPLHIVPKNNTYLLKATNAPKGVYFLRFYLNNKQHCKLLVF